MSENKIKRYGYASWWPDSSDAKEYAFRKSLETGERGAKNYLIASLARQQYKNSIQSLIDTFPESLDSLQTLINREKASELNFLRKNGFENIDNSIEWTEVVKSINSILNTEGIYKRNLQKIYEYENKISNSGQIDITRFFTGYLEGALRKWIENPNNNELRLSQGKIREIVYQALIDMFKSKDIKDDDNSPMGYIELANALEAVGNTHPLVDRVLNLYDTDILLKQFIRLRTDWRKQGNKRKKGITKSKIEISNLPQKTGALLEYVSDMIITELKNLPGQHTGALHNMKADEIIMDIDLKIDLSELEDSTNSNSIRIQNIERLEDMYQKLQQSYGDIVFISDKNYDIGNNKWFKRLGGFEAENPNLDNLKLLLNKIQYKKVEDLIFILRNTGKDMISEDTQDIDVIRRNIAYNIGNFLFDDIAVTDILKPPGINNVHLFNLGNIYIPLSLLLQNIYDTIQDLSSQDFRNFVNVEINMNENDVEYEKATGPLTQSDWINYANKRNSNVHLTIRFLKSFSNIVAENIDKLK